MDALLELLDQTTRALDELESKQSLESGQRRRLRDLLETIATRSTGLIERLENFDEAELPPNRRKYRDELLEEGLSALARNQFETARQHFEEGVEAFPDDLEFLNHLGLACWEEEAYREAARWYGRAMEAGLSDLSTHGGNRCDALSSAYLRAMEGRALSLKRLGRESKAATLFETLATREPQEYAGCHYLAGEIHHKQDDLDEALEAYERAPEEPAVLYNTALAEFELGHLEHAAADLIRAFEANPHIASLLLEGETVEALSGCGGYVGSATYAEEVVDSSQRLWGETDGAQTFLDRCFRHPLVSEYLHTADAASDESPSPPQMSLPDTADNCVHGIAAYLAERMD